MFMQVAVYGRGTEDDEDSGTPYTLRPAKMPVLKAAWKL